MTRKRFIKLLMGDCTLSRNEAVAYANKRPEGMSYKDYYNKCRLELSNLNFEGLCKAANRLSEVSAELGTSMQDLANMIHNWEQKYWSGVWGATVQ